MMIIIVKQLLDIDRHREYISKSGSKYPGRLPCLILND